MSINIQSKTDYSALFGSLPGSVDNSTGMAGLTSSVLGGSGSLNLADYASIKNGSYGKLLKAYYAEAEGTQKSSSANKTSASKSKGLDSSKDKVSAYTGVAESAKDLTKVADKLISKGTDSLFNNKSKTVTDEAGNSVVKNEPDRTAIDSAVKDFVKAYNTFVNKGLKSDNATISRETESLTNLVGISATKLKDIGITIEDDKSLKINEDTYNKASTDDIKKLFNGNQSVAYSVSSKASLIGISAESAAKNASNYTSSGNYTDSYSAGSILNSIV
ncbi:MAG: hypothetical protein K5662_02045 [Lachnospiraceae bacterium]|nr:hypothetical protein [Lachnospiraceae bacterium]